jgi:hypothetical protein
MDTFIGVQISEVPLYTVQYTMAMWIEVVVFPQVPGAQDYAITSDDLFFLQKPPGRTLVF